MQRLALVNRAAPKRDFASDVREGLTSSPKFLLPQYFYDEIGSALFDAICHLPEYYPTRCEAEILQSRGEDIVRAFGSSCRLVELGSGSARKTRLLLDPLTRQQPDLEYVAVDVDASMLRRASSELLREYDHLRVTGVSGDFRRPSEALSGIVRPDIPNLVLFLGSTIGNLDHDEAVVMLEDLRGCLSPGDALLLGADLKKPKEILEPAYDDALGVTAAFNRNILLRINRELGGAFILDRFAHRAFYDEERSRVEMHLVSLDERIVPLEGCTAVFAEGESIHTENSYKYDEASLGRMAADAGFALERIWTDAKGWFADALLRV